MRLVFVGDVVGQAGREALKTYLPDITDTLRPDVIIVNGENAAHGIGITPKICEEMFDLGVHIITLGNHSWDKKEILPYIKTEPRLVRPANYPEGTPGAGAYTYTLPDGRSLTVINIMGRVFMEALDNPFTVIDTMLETIASHAIFIDFHAEATSEKQAFAHYVDGRVAAVVGTHTHVPTADDRILPGGTATLTDAGMTGCYEGVIGVKTDCPIERFTTQLHLYRMEPSDGEGTLAGCVVDTDDRTGLAVAIETIRLGPNLKNTSLGQVAAALADAARRG